MRKLGGELWTRWCEGSLDRLWDAQRTLGRDGGSWDPAGIWIRGRQPVPQVWLSRAELRPRIDAALARVEAEPCAPAAYRELAATLAVADSPTLLRRTLRRAARITPHAAALVHLRLGMVYSDGGRAARAIRHVRAAYEAAGRPDNVLAYYVDALRRCGRLREALNLLLAEGGRPGAGKWQDRVTAALLFDPAIGIADPVGYVLGRLPAEPQARAGVLTALADGAESEGRAQARVAFLGQAFHESGRLAALVEPYIAALMDAKAFAVAARELESVVQSGYHTAWAFETLARAYAELGRPQGEIVRALSGEVEIFPRDPQPRLTLAEHFEAHGRPDDAMAQYMEAARLRPDDAYFARLAIERTVACGRLAAALGVVEDALKAGADPAELGPAAEQEFVDLLRQHKAAKDKAQAARLAAAIRQFVTKDLVVVLRWDTVGTDVDLHVTEPDGAECSYEKMKTPSGGRLDHDNTEGLGPETYALRRAKPGKYRIDVVYYSGVPCTRVTVQVYRHRNGPDESVATHAGVLAAEGQRVTVATVEVPPPR
jgi:tetratricopeptide (TPR) repeat protein